MMPAKVLKQEIKRYPSFIKKAIASNELDEALRYKIELATMEFILDYESKEWGDK